MSAPVAGDWVRNLRTGLVRLVLEARSTEVVVGLPHAWGTRVWRVADVEPVQVTR